MICAVMSFRMQSILILFDAIKVFSDIVKELILALKTDMFINAFIKTVINGVSNAESINRHIHKHLCPNRVKRIELTPNQSIEPKSYFNQNLEEIEILRKVKPFLERRQADNEVLYKCNCCQFISIDLKALHFI